MATSNQPMSNQVRLGRYLCGGYTDVSGNMLGWWERVVFPTDPSDISFPLTQRYNCRPDLVAFDLYGRADLQWFVMQYNNVIDVTVQFIVGTEVTLPTRVRLFGEILVAAPQTSPL
jgi:hypothetical protein